MSVLESLKKLIGGRWTGLRFGLAGRAGPPTAEQRMRLCQAIAASSEAPISLPVKMISCAGGRRSLGLDDPPITEMAWQVSQEAGIPREAALRILASAPRLGSPSDGVVLGPLADADVVIGYLLPEAGMRLIRRWQTRRQSNLSVETSAFMAICGNLVVRAHRLGGLCLSLGCPESRRLGGLGDNELVVAMPRDLAADLVEDMENRAANG